jgi:4-amino-4-deoxy-L-arabinose transferase-like glycosyltransferase
VDEEPPHPFGGRREDLMAVGKGKFGIMEQSLRKWSEGQGAVFILIVFCLLIYAVNLGQWDLWNPDEPRYGQVAKEMVNRGDWIIMHRNGKMYTDKPPLFFWMIALSSFLWQGFSSFSVRFPSAVFGTLTVLLVFLLGKRLYTHRVGFVSGLILATSFEFAFLATRANIDATLTFFTTASLYCFFQWYYLVSSDLSRLPSGKRDEARKTFYIYGFYVAMALATLAKGPVGFILPLLVGMIFLAIQRDWKKMKTMKLLPGMFLCVVLVLAWYLPAILQGGHVYLNETLFKHSLERYSSGWAHRRPFYYYFYNFPAQFLPWALFIPGAWAYGLSRKRTGNSNSFLLLFVWFAVIFLFFSLSKGKRELYLLPLYPAASLMVGKFLDDFLSRITGPLSDKWISIPFYVLVAVMLLAGAAAPVVLIKKLPSYLVYGLPMSFLMVGGSLALFFGYRAKNYPAVFFLLVGIVAGAFFYTQRVVFPLVNPYKSGRYISEEITSRIQPGEQVGLFGDFGTGPYNFYTEIVPIREMEEKEELLGFLNSAERVFCILKARDLRVLRSLEGKAPFQLISRRRVGNDEVALISNR